jgi:carnitine O-acetyltransferase
MSLTATTITRRQHAKAKQQRHHQLSLVSTTARESHALFKSWATPVVVSHGDYRQEQWLEEHIGGPLYQQQKSLPRLPVPAIVDTLERFLPTALPLARSAEEEARLREAVRRFPSQAARLQERLLQRRQDEFPDSSWLQLWWNTVGYLQVRDPVVVNVSYFFHLADDPHATTHVTRGAALLAAVADFRQQVCSGSLPAEAVGSKSADKPRYLCSTAYKYMFHACRIPAREQDSYKIYDPAQHHHAIVVRRGHFFALDFCHPVTGDAYPLSVLQDGLEQIMLATAAVHHHDHDNNNVPLELGWLTSSNRDDWADARRALLEAGGVAMELALERLESGAVLLCLDDEAPVSRQECAELFLHGSRSAGGNRWFDKSVQLVVTNNGKAGLIGEHSMMDGMPMVGLANYCTQKTYDKRDNNTATASSSANVEPIFGNVLHELNDGITSTLVEKGESCG